ncbi:class I poly(R)-hydroxyalkanoic acid synthase [Aureimonas fodinaquatilis]|uniref:Class I poly(R)-hydroxyalkanoic acid synthase n=1 Tax=Aureimonas fodinaquatilis TaxID=2565783 RepID=A0A5B0DXX5_9HYPH|nr:class I poly(R)-hydroxyalkanoic acid synthase [Aureimonas fodinaquatilis]KAA0970735.1 class I poly(R)-hydroxyalkanoic acid synthase [Aureimonas fodinaquatilis]
MSESEKPRQGDFAPYVVRDPQAFALNVARAVEQAGKAASAWLAPRDASNAPVDPSNAIYGEMVSAFSEIGNYWLADPHRALEAQTRLLAGYMDIWSRSIRKVSGDATHDTAVETPDKRFNDPEWRENLFFDFMRQVYILTGAWARSLVTEAEGLDEETRNKADFYVNQIVNAISPSNFIATNPELYRQTVEENGANLVRGMQMFAEDMTRGAGNLKLRQTRPGSFEVGVNLAVTPGSVVAENDLCQIIQYAPTTQAVFKRPILICPPWINRFYILDLTPEKSFIAWLVDQGHTVFVISWINPDLRHADKDWLSYIDEGLVFALDTIAKATRETEVNAIGYCVGGTLLSAGMALLKRRGDTRIQTATLLATQVDFEHAGDLKVFVDERQIAALEAVMTPSGTLDGGHMATAFNLLRSSDLIWPYVVGNYMKGREPPPFDLLYWNSDATRMAKANHSFYLRKFYLENQLTAGLMELDGGRISLSDVTVPVYSLATREDHIAPARSVYQGCLAFGGEVTYVLAGSGHIAGVINPPHKNKYQYLTGPAPKADVAFADWVADAPEQPGSWWPHWQSWVEPHAGPKVKARKPGVRGKTIEPAPGRYVRE